MHECKDVTSVQMNNIVSNLKNPYKLASEVQHNTKFFNAMFTNKYLPQIVHKTFIESCKNNDEYGYQTSYYSASANNFYNKNPLITKYDGPSKTSTLLSHKIEDLIQISDETESSNIKQL